MKKTAQRILNALFTRSREYRVTASVAGRRITVSVSAPDYARALAEAEAIVDDGFILDVTPA